MIMEIIKPGTARKVRFVCFECDCVYDANLGEAVVTRQSSEFVSYSCGCPMCNYMNTKIVNTHRPEMLMQTIGKYGKEERV